MFLAPPGSLAAFLIVPASLSFLFLTARVLGVHDVNVWVFLKQVVQVQCQMRIRGTSVSPSGPGVIQSTSFQSQEAPFRGLGWAVLLEGMPTMT